MTSNTLDPQLFSRSNASNQGNRDFLWNVVQPGDPYDIRRSMIVSLPGKQGKSLKDKPEVICMLQAAQIERLNQYLQEYQIRYKELQRKQLDRHSYQIQIRELTQKLRGQEYFQIEVQKLNDFIKRLTAENEELRRNTRGEDRGRSGDYESALKKIDSLLVEIQSLRKQNQSFSLTTENYRAQLSSMERAKNREIDQLRRKLQNYQYTTSSLQEANSLKLRYENDILNLERELSKSSEIIKMKNMEIEDLMTRNRFLEDKSRQSQIKSREVAELERKIAMLSQEVQRLHLITQDKQKRYDEVSRNNTYIENEFRHLENDRNRLNDEFRKVSSENNGLRVKITQVESEREQLLRERNDISLLNEKLRNAGEEIDRLNRLIHNQTNDINHLRQQNRQLQYQLSNVSILEKQNQDLRRNTSELDQLKRLITQYENKLALISSELERLKEVNKKERDQNNVLRDEIEILRRQISLTQTNIRNTYETKINQIRTDHQIQVTNIINRGNPQADFKINSLHQEIDHLNSTILKLQQENNNLKNILRDNEINHDRQERQGIQIINQLNKKIQNLQYLNSELQRQLFDLREKNNRAGQNEQQLIKIRRDYETIIIDYQNQDALVKSLQNRIFELQSLLHNKDRQINQHSNRVQSLYEEKQIIKRGTENAGRNIDSLRRQNQELRRRLTDVEQQMRTYKDEINSLIRENDDLRRNMAAYGDQEHKIRTYIEEINIIKRQKDQVNRKNINDQEQQKRSFAEEVNALRRQNDELRRKLANYGDKEMNYLDEINNLKKQNDELRRQLAHYGDQEHRYHDEITISKRENEELHRRLIDYGDKEAKIRALIDEINYLKLENEKLKNQLTQIERTSSEHQTVIQNKYQTQITQVNNRYITIQNKYNDATNQNRRLEDLLREKDDTIRRLTQKIDSQSIHTKTTYNNLMEANQKIDDLIRQNTSLKDQLNQANSNVRSLETEVGYLKSDIKRLNDRIKNLEDENNEYYSRTKSLSTEYESIKHKHNIYQNDLSESKRQNDDLKKRIQEDGYLLSQYHNKFPVFENQVDRLQHIINKKDGKIKNLEDIIRDKDEEINNFRYKVTQIHQKKIDLERRVSDLQRELRVYERDADELARLRRQLADVENRRLRSTNEYQEKIRSLEREIYRLTEEIRIHNEDFHKEKQNKEDLIHRIKGLQKKKNKDDINKAYTVTRLTYLEEEMKRIKEEKRKIQDKSNNELKVQLEKLLDENMGLKKQINDLQTRLIQLNQNQARERRRLIEEYEKRITELNSRINELSGRKSIDREKYKNIIKIVNNDTNDRNNFYQDQIKRVRDDKNGNAQKLKAQIEFLTKQLQDERRKNRQIEDKARRLEQTIVTLNRELSDFFNNTSKRDIENKYITDQYENINKRYSEIERKDFDQRNQISSLQLTINRASEQARNLKRTIQDLKRLQVKIGDYENQISMLERQIKRLSEENKRHLDELVAKDDQLFALKREKENLALKIRDLEFQLDNTSRNYKDQEKILIGVRDDNERNRRDYSETKDRLIRTERQKDSLNQGLNQKKASLDELTRINQRQEQELQRYRREYETRVSTYESTIKSLQVELDELHRKLLILDENQRNIIELKNKIRALEDEIARLNRNLTSKGKELKQLETAMGLLKSDQQANLLKIRALERQNHEITEKYEEKILNIEHCVNSLTKENSQLRKKKLEEMRQLNRKISDQQSKIALLKQEIERLTSKLKNASSNHEDQLDRIRNLERENNDLRRKVDSTTSDFSHKTLSYEESLGALNRENEILKKKAVTLEDLHIKTQQLQRLLSLSDSQISRLHGVLTSKEREISQLKIQVEDANRRYERTISEKEGESQKIQLEKSQYSKLLVDYKSLERKLEQYERTIQDINSEFERLETQMKIQQQERTTHLEKNRLLLAEVDRLNRTKKELEGENEILNGRIADQIALEKRIQEHLGLFVVLFAEIESLRNRVNEKEREIEQVRRDSLTKL